MDDHNKGCENDSGWSSPELDVVSCTPGPGKSSTSQSSAEDPNNHKRYFCQRCLNHLLEYPRKGHKPFCRYAQCHCNDCMMVEYRRRLNNQLSQRKVEPESSGVSTTTTTTSSVSNTPTGNSTKQRTLLGGKKIRDPKCARCSAHGEEQALRGHKKATCPYLKCGCHLCNLVENRRTLMAKQIKLRRDQQKARRALLYQNNDENEIKLPTTSSRNSPSSKAQENAKKESSMFMTSNKMLTYSIQDSAQKLSNEANAKTLIGFLSEAATKNAISQEKNATFLNTAKTAITTNAPTNMSQFVPKITNSEHSETTLLNLLKSPMVKLENLTNSSVAKISSNNNSFDKSFVLPLMDSKSFAQFAANQNAANNSGINFNFASTPTSCQQQLPSPPRTSQFEAFNAMPLLGISAPIASNNILSTTPSNLPQSTAQLSPIFAALCQENNENSTTTLSRLTDSSAITNLPMPKPIHPFDSLKALMPLNQFASPFFMNQAALIMPLNVLGFPFNISNLLFNQYSSGINQIFNNNASSTTMSNVIGTTEAEIPSNQII